VCLLAQRSGHDCDCLSSGASKAIVALWLSDEDELYDMVMKYCARRGCMKPQNAILGRVTQGTGWSMINTAR